ncbi:MAG: hypothetical protein ACT4OK_14050 [Gemmobacter sp.]
MRRSSILSVVRSLATVGLLPLAGCGPTALGPEVAGFSDALSAATAPMEAGLQLRAAAEEAAAQTSAIAGGKEVYKPPSRCVSAASLAPGTRFSDCAPEPLNVAPEAPGSAKAMLAYIRTLRSYAETLSALAATDAPQAVATEFGGLLGEVQALAAVRPEFANLQSRIGAVRAPLTSLAGQLAEAQRTRLIRDLVRAAGPGIEDLTSRLISFRDADDGLSAATEALQQAYVQMESARRSGNSAAYAATVRDYEATHADLRARLMSSDAGRLVLIRDAQAALTARVSAPGDIEAFVTLIETIKALTDSVQGG